MVESISDSLIKAAQLPPLPETLLKILDACDDPESDIATVGQLAAQESVIAGKILRLANSAFLGAQSSFSSIEQATIFLGINAIRNLAISVSVQETFKDFKTSKNFNKEEFWYHSLLTALLAKNISQACEYDNPEEAYLAGLLHDLGKYLFSLVFKEKYQKFYLEFANSPDRLAREYEIFKNTHADASGQLANYYCLMPEIVSAISNHHDEFKGPTKHADLDIILSLANHCAHTGQDVSSKCRQLAHNINLSEDVLVSIIRTQLDELDTIAASLGISITKSVKKPLPKDTGQKEATTLLKEQVKDMAQVHGLLDALARAKTLNQILLVFEQSLTILCDINKSVFLLPNEDGSYSIKGSFRNQIAQQFKNKRFFKQLDSFINTAISTEGKIVAIDENITPLSNSFQEDQLHCYCFNIGNDRKASLFMHLPFAHDSASTNNITIYIGLLVPHICHRLELEWIKRQHIEKRLQLQTSIVEEIATSLAHEIANPLGIMQNYISLLVENDQLEPTIHKELRIISNEIQRIGKITQQLNGLSSHGNNTLHQYIDINRLIEETIMFFSQNKNIGKRISFFNEYIETQKNVLTCPDSVRQILYNLIGNSIDSIGDSTGDITIKSIIKKSTTGNNTKDLCISVKDNGQGIDPSLTDSLFRPGTTSKGQGHAGLGLAIVQKLAKNINGTISCNTTTANETVFTLRLPIKNH